MVAREGVGCRRGRRLRAQEGEEIEGAGEGAESEDCK
jgi:hypothetical protein